MPSIVSGSQWQQIIKEKMEAELSKIEEKEAKKN